MKIKIIGMSRILILYILILLNLILISETLAASNATNFGNKIIWASNRKNVQFDIFKMDTDGQNVLNLIESDFPSDNLVDEHAIWSPDESKIVWVRGGDIWTMNADGTGKTQLTTSGDCGHPSYSPDGAKIVYVRHGLNGLYDVWTMNSNGTGQALLFSEVDTDNVHPSYSPAGTKIVLARDTDRSNKSGKDRFEIWTIDTNGTNPVRIYPPPGDYTPATAPSYSPAGSKIVFARDTLEDVDSNGTIDDWNGDGIPDERDEKYEIWVMNSDGTNLVKLTGYLTDGNFKGLTPPYNDVTPYFSGLGTEMDFVRDIGDLEIFKMNADGSNQVNLTDDPNQDSKVVESTCGCNPVGILFDFGDAMDPNYPSKIASNGAFHVDVTKEWLGSKVDRETDSKQVNKDKFDDGVILANRFTPSTPNTVRILVNNNGLGIARYDMSNPQKIIYINGWADWNGDGDWKDGGEKIIGTGSGNVTCTNIVGFDTVGVAPAGGGITTITCSVTPPAAVAGTFYTRFRLDYGEDAGVVQNISGTLNQEIGEAKYGEVEDYRNIMDFGDAPDDSQAPGLVAYPGVPAKFPTLFNTINSTIPGNKGAYHVILDEEWLSDVSPSTTTAESEALIVDADFDDAFPLIIYLPGASPNTGWVLVPVTVATEGRRYLNILLDQNHNGKWKNGICTEHIVADGYLYLTPGTHWILTPAIGLCDHTQSQWMRVTLTTEPIGIADWDGSAPPTGFSNGETEDWIMDETISPANIVPNDSPPGIPIDDPVPGKVVPTYDYMFDDQDPNDGLGVVGGHAAWVWQPWPPPPGTISAVIQWPRNSMTDFMLHVRNTNNVGPNPVDTPIGSYNTVVGGIAGDHAFLPDGRGCWRVSGTNLSPAIGALGPGPHDGTIPMAPSIVTEDTANILNVPAAAGGPGDVGGFLAQWGDVKDGTVWSCIHDLVYDPGGITIETIPSTEEDEVLEPIALVQLKCISPTAIHLSSFNVLQQNSYNLISWSTGTERDTEGFYILRSTSANGPYTRLIPYAIESKGDSLAGSSYSFIDMNVSQSINYYYKLEEVDARGNLSHYGPVAAVAGNRSDNSDNSEQVTEVTSHQGEVGNEGRQKKRDASPAYTIVAYADGPAKFLSGEVVDEETVQGIRSLVFEDRGEKLDIRSQKLEVRGEKVDKDMERRDSPSDLSDEQDIKREGITASPVSLSFRIIDAEGNDVAVASLETEDNPHAPSFDKGGILKDAKSGDFALQNRWDGGRVILTWHTAKPVKGFHILRSPEKDGSYRQITKTLIPYIGTGIEGVTGQIFRFTYTDRNVQKGKDYYYKLEPVLREDGKTASRQGVAY